MRDLLNKLYRLAGENAPHVTKMLIFECLKGIFDSWSLGGILYLLMRMCESVFDAAVITMNDVFILTLIVFISVAGKITCGYLADKHKNIAA